MYNEFNCIDWQIDVQLRLLYDMAVSGPGRGEVADDGGVRGGLKTSLSNLQHRRASGMMREITTGYLRRTLGLISVPNSNALSRQFG